mgnify:CR=1 FL=1
MPANFESYLIFIVIFLDDQPLIASRVSKRAIWNQYTKKDKFTIYIYFRIGREIVNNSPATNTGEFAYGIDLS